MSTFNVFKRFFVVIIPLFPVTLCYSQINFLFECWSCRQIYIYIYIYYILYIYIYSTPHNLCFNLFILHNSFDNQVSEISKNNIFLCFNILMFQHTVFYQNFISTTHSRDLYLDILALALEFIGN